MINNTGITGALREEIDKLWLDFWVGGITNPLTVIEQISYLMFCRLLDQAESVKERRALKLHKPYHSIYEEMSPALDDRPLEGKFGVGSRVRIFATARADSGSSETKQGESVR